MKALYALLLGATLAACASVQPARVELGDRCLRCRRPIQDLRLAGEIVDTMRAPFPFRTPGCLAKYVKANSGMALTAIFVTDFRTGKMIPAGDAWFVPTSLTSPDGRTAEPDYYAFRSRADAQQFKADAASVMRWNQVVAAAE
jgi:hypothetical protein